MRWQLAYITECEAHVAADFQNLNFSSDFPVDHGTKLKVICNRNFILQSGSSTVLCLSGNLLYEEKPQCVLYSKYNITFDVLEVKQLDSRLFD